MIHNEGYPIDWTFRQSSSRMTMLFGVQRFTQFLRLLTLPLFVLVLRLLSAIVAFFEDKARCDTAGPSRGVSSQLCTNLSAFVTKHRAHKELVLRHEAAMNASEDTTELYLAIDASECTLDRLKEHIADETEDFQTRRDSLSWWEQWLTLLARLLLRQSTALELNELICDGCAFGEEIEVYRETITSSKHHMRTYAFDCFGTTWGPRVFYFLLVVAEHVLPCPEQD